MLFSANNVSLVDPPMEAKRLADQRETAGQKQGKNKTVVIEIVFLL
jgi:hypothetical protein